MRRVNGGTMTFWPPAMAYKPRQMIVIWHAGLAIPATGALVGPVTLNPERDTVIAEHAYSAVGCVN
jgi:hypothetical protein